MTLIMVTSHVHACMSLVLQVSFACMSVRAARCNGGKWGKGGLGGFLCAWCTRRVADGELEKHDMSHGVGQSEGGDCMHRCSGSDVAESCMLSCDRNVIMNMPVETILVTSLDDGP